MPSTFFTSIRPIQYPFAIDLFSLAHCAFIKERRYSILHLCQLCQQRLRLLQIARVETLSEPPEHRSQQFARLLHLALVAPEAGEAHCGAQLKRLGILTLGDSQRLVETSLGRRPILARLRKQHFAFETMKLGVPPMLARAISDRLRLLQNGQSFVDSTGLPAAFAKQGKIIRSKHLYSDAVQRFDFHSHS